MEPALHVVTDLDPMELRDLRFRIEALVARIGPARVRPLMSNGDLAFGDDEGMVTLRTVGAILEIQADRWAGMGALALHVPMPASTDHRKATATRMGAATVPMLLSTILALIDAGLASGARPGVAVDRPQRLVGAVSALVLSANAEAAGGSAPVHVDLAFPWRHEIPAAGGARPPAIRGPKGPILARALERRLLDLHPAATLTRNDGPRSFRIGPARTFATRIEPLDALSTMRLLAELAPRLGQPVLTAAGRALR